MTTVASISADDLRQRIKRKSRLTGRQADDASLAEVRALLGTRPMEGWPRDRLIEHLHLLNDRHLGLHERHLVALARETNVPMAEVYEVASFYHHFDILRDGDVAPALTVRVCNGLSCEMAGAGELLARLPMLLGGEVRVIAAPCVGRCEQAPVAVVHQYPIPRASAAGVEQAVALHLTRHPQPSAGPAFEPAGRGPHAVTASPVQVAPMVTDFDAYCAAGGYVLAADLAAGRRDAESVLAQLEGSGLRGLGGAGFPAGRKWRIVRDQPAPRLMAVNIDEGEPGTFKDRTYLERDPHRVLEGLVIAAAVVGIDACYVYLRDEYHGCRELLTAELQKLQRHATFKLPHIELRRGAGAYICGEETGLIESLEGKRAWPRIKPPFPAIEGAFRKPTIVNNVETMACVTQIMRRGIDWFKSLGVPPDPKNPRDAGSFGPKLYTIAGHVNEPKCVELPMGVTLRDLVEKHGGGVWKGRKAKTVNPGGLSMGFIDVDAPLKGEEGKTEYDIPLDFNGPGKIGCLGLGTAAITVIDDQTSMVDVLHNVCQFFSHESCGQCTPCREGTGWMLKITDRLRRGQGRREDLDILIDVADRMGIMPGTTICGLADGAGWPVKTAIRKFRAEFEASIKDGTRSRHAKSLELVGAH